MLQLKAFLDQLKARHIILRYELVEDFYHEEDKLPYQLRCSITTHTGRHFNPRILSKKSKKGYEETCLKFIDYIEALIPGAKKCNAN